MRPYQCPRRLGVMVVVVSCIAAFAVPAAATDYYISPGGRDANNGTSPSTPWQTFRPANLKSFAPGDRILLEGGQTINGTLNLGADDAGTAASPITVSSYGTGRATIAAASNPAIQIYNTSRIHVQNLNLAGSGAASNTGNGITVYADLPGDVKLPDILVENVTVTGFGRSGVEIGSWNGATGFRDVTIRFVTASQNGRAGISTYSAQPNVHQNVYVGYSKTFSNPGFSVDESTGNGIVLGNVDGAVVERCVAHDNGTAAVGTHGPQGVWTYYSRNVLIQYNESYNNHTGGWADGGGFGLDIGVTSSTIQYNYSHGNDGAGVLVAGGFDPAPHGNNTIRYNVSQNDARRNGYGSLEIWGHTSASQFFNNTVFTSADPSFQARAVYVTNDYAAGNYATGVGFRNNVIFVTGSISNVEITAAALSGSSVRFEGNDYYGVNGGVRILWGETAYTSLTDWRAATSEERLNGSDTGGIVDPQLTNPGGGQTFDDATALSSLDAYRLRSTSPLIDAGLNLSSLGISPGPHDYFDTPLFQGNGYDVGAHEAIAAPPSPNTPPAVSIASPAAGATFTAPASISLTATASDADGSVSEVDFYGGGLLIGTDTTPPYTVVWSNLPAGTYELKAVATDNVGASTTSMSVIVTVVPPPPAQPTPFGGTAAAIPGTIEAENFDEGGEGVAYHDTTTGNSGGQYRSTNVDIEASTEHGYDVGWIAAGEWLAYTVNVGTAGSYTLEARVACSGAGGTFHVEAAGVNKTGPLTIPNTGGWQTWTSVTVTVTLDAGPQVLRVVFDSGGPGGPVGNLNYLRLSSTSPPPAVPEIVIYAADLPSSSITGWSNVADPDAAAGVELSTADVGWSTTSAPLAAPSQYFDATFQAQAGVRYRLWLRLKATGDSKWNDSVWVQFSNAADSSGRPVYPIGTTAGLLVNLENCSGCGVGGWGWQNRAYWLSDTGDVWFGASGWQTIRVQIREDGVMLDQIVISPNAYLLATPGVVTNDHTIVPKP